MIVVAHIIRKQFSTHPQFTLNCHLILLLNPFLPMEDFLFSCCAQRQRHACLFLSSIWLCPLPAHSQEGRHKISPCSCFPSVCTLNLSEPTSKIIFVCGMVLPNPVTSQWLSLVSSDSENNIRKSVWLYEHLYPTFSTDFCLTH